MKQFMLPEDYSGKSPANLVKNEKVTTVNRQIRAILPEYGAFFAKSAKITDVATGQELKRGVQFYAVEMYPDATDKAGKEVCAVLLVVDEKVGNELLIEYQALGGESHYSTIAVQTLINDAKIDGREVDFYSIQGRPRKYPVAPHQHAGRDIYGWDYVVRELNRLSNTIQVGSAQQRLFALELIIRVLANVIAEADKAMQELLVTHKADRLAHTQYVTHDELAERVDLVRQPTCDIVKGATTLDLVGTPYTSFYGIAHSSSHFQVSRQADFSALLVDRTTGATNQYRVTETLPKNVQLLARVKYRDRDGAESAWSNPIGFTLT